ncbi:hypothetical protein ACWGH8_04455 [Nonomuraea muscovyensis]
MRDEEGVQIAELVSTGIAQFHIMAGDLDTAYRPDEAELRGLLASRVWGTGPAGIAFFQALQALGGPERWLDDTDALVRDINKTPTKLRRAVGNSLSTDDAVAEYLARALGPA